MQPFDPFFVYAVKVITLKGTLNKFILSISRQNGLKNNTPQRLYLESVNNVCLLTREARQSNVEKTHIPIYQNI